MPENVSKGPTTTTNQTTAPKKETPSQQQQQQQQQNKKADDRADVLVPLDEKDIAPPDLLVRKMRMMYLSLGDKVTVKTDLRIVLPRKVYVQMMAYGHAIKHKSEISMLGTSEIRGDEITVNELFLIEQAGSFASSQMDADAISEFVMQRMPAVRDGSAERISVIVHTHPGMGCMWSQTDEACIKRLRGGQYLVSIVFDPIREEYKARVDTGCPMASLDCLELLVDSSDDESVEGIVKTCLEEVKQKVRKFAPVEKVSVKSLFQTPTSELVQKDHHVGVYCGRCGTYHYSQNGECPACPKEDELEDTFEDEYSWEVYDIRHGSIFCQFCEEPDGHHASDCPVLKAAKEMGCDTFDVDYCSDCGEFTNRKDQNSLCSCFSIFAES